MVMIKRKKEMSEEELNAQETQKELQKAGIQDEFQAKGFELVAWMQDHKGIVIGLIVVLVGLGAIWSGYVVMRRSGDEKASVLYQVAQDSFEKTHESHDKDPKSLEAARTAFGKVVESYPRTDVANLARLQMAALSVDLGDNSSALKNYAAFVDNVSSKNPLYQVGLLGLAFAQEQAGDKKAALSTYIKFFAIKDHIADEGTLWASVRLAKEFGEVSKVRLWGQDLLTRFPNSSHAGEVKTLLSQASDTTKPVVK